MMGVRSIEFAGRSYRPAKDDWLIRTDKAATPCCRFVGGTSARIFTETIYGVSHIGKERVRVRPRRCKDVSIGDLKRTKQLEAPDTTYHYLVVRELIDRLFSQKALSA